MLREPAHRFTVSDFYRIADTGVFGENQRVELLDGEVTDMMPIGDFHASKVDILTLLFGEQCRRRFQPRIQNPLKLDDQTLLQPDVLLLKPRPDFYGKGTPQPDDVLLLIEVSDTSLDFDQHEKLPRCARAGIEEVWIINVPQRQVEVYRDPNYLSYAQTTTLKPGQSASPAAFPDVSIPVSSLFS